MASKQPASIYSRCHSPQSAFNPRVLLPPVDYVNIPRMQATVEIVELHRPRLYTLAARCFIATPLPPLLKHAKSCFIVSEDTQQPSTGRSHTCSSRSNTAFKSDCIFCICFFFSKSAAEHLMIKRTKGQRATSDHTVKPISSLPSMLKRLDSQPHWSPMTVQQPCMSPGEECDRAVLAGFMVLLQGSHSTSS